MVGNYHIELQNDSLAAIDLINKSKKVVRSIHCWAGRIAGAPFAIPKVLFSHIILFTLTYSIKRKFNKFINNCITTENYSDIKASQEILNSLVKRLARVNKIPISNVAIVHKLLMLQIKDIFSLFTSMKKQIDLKIDELNIHQPDVQIFETVSEDNLWKMRAKVYDYIA